MAKLAQNESQTLSCKSKQQAATEKKNQNNISVIKNIKRKRSRVGDTWTESRVILKRTLSSSWSACETPRHVSIIQTNNEKLSKNTSKLLFSRLKTLTLLLQTSSMFVKLRDTFNEKRDTPTTSSCTESPVPHLRHLNSSKQSPICTPSLNRHRVCPVCLPHYKDIREGGRASERLVLASQY